MYSSKYQANTNDIFLSKVSLAFISNVGTEFKNGYFKEATKLADIKILMINDLRQSTGTRFRDESGN